MLLESMPYLMKQQQRPMGAGGAGPHRGYQGGKPNPGGMRPNNRGYNNQMGSGSNMRPNHMQGGQQQMQMNGAPAPQPQQMQQQMMMEQQRQQEVAQRSQMSQMSIEQRYIMACHQILAAVMPENPNYKDQVGTVLYEYIAQIVGPKAPKVTGMLIDLPIEDIKLIMQDWSLLNTRVNQASELLDNQPQ